MALATVLAVVVLQWLLRAHGASWGDAIQVVATVVVAVSTVLYAALTRSLVAITADQKEEAARLHRVQDLTRVARVLDTKWNELHRLRRSNFPLDVRFERPADASAAFLSDVAPSLIEAMTDVSHEAVALRQDDLLCVSAVARSIGACSTKIGNGFIHAKAEAEKAAAGSGSGHSLGWEEIASAYETTVRHVTKGLEGCGWDEIRNGQPLSDVLEQITNAIMELRGRAGHLEPPEGFT